VQAGDVRLSTHLLVAELPPALVQAALQVAVDVDRAFDREWNADLRVLAQPLLGGVYLTDLAQHPRVDGGLPGDRLGAVERHLVAPGRELDGAHRLLTQLLGREQPARAVVELARLEQREREGEAAAVRLGTVEPRHDPIEVLERRRGGRDHVGVRAYAAVVE
jgi:hypothetical protein